jgi:hypothetical protein
MKLIFPRLIQRFNMKFNTKKQLNFYVKFDFKKMDFKISLAWNMLNSTSKINIF